MPGAGSIVKPAVQGTMRARKARKAGRRVRAQHVASYIAAAVLVTWLSKTLDKLIDRWGEPGAD